MRVSWRGRNKYVSYILTLLGIYQTISSKNCTYFLSIDRNGDISFLIIHKFMRES